jgi:pimeloyl-ACP methyl ester carboxylesterase
VLVHGLDSSKETWSGVLADLAACGYPAIALDLRGHGESPLGHPADFSPAALASDVLHAVRAAGIDRYVLVGHSMGGRIAMRAAALEAEALDGAARAGAIKGSAGTQVKGKATNGCVLRAVVIEDMDISPREWDPSLTAEEEERLADWDVTRGGRGRAFQTWEGACHKIKARPI